MFELIVTDDDGAIASGVTTVTVDPSIVEPEVVEPEVVEPEEVERGYLPPGSYASVADCAPVQGSSEAALKVLFVNINEAEYYDAILADAIEQLNTTAPFSDYTSQFAVYTLTVSADDAALDCEKSVLSCDRDVVEAAISAVCTISDLEAVFKVVIVSSDLPATGGEVIYIGSMPSHSEETSIALLKNTFIHELAHNFGLADLYSGTLLFSGAPSRFYPTDFARSFLNVDGPGCGKWCNGFKPATEYTESSTAACLVFEDQDSCITHNRTDTGDCEIVDADGNYECCVWLDEPLEYFENKCVPHWGTEDIGLDCLAGTGCYGFRRHRSGL